MVCWPILLQDHHLTSSSAPVIIPMAPLRMMSLECNHVSFWGVPETTDAVALLERTVSANILYIHSIIRENPSPSYLLSLPPRPLFNQ